MEQTFESMQLNRTLIEALKLAEITVPTEIQQKVIPQAKQNIDLIFQSETGTGKTLAYLLPLFEKIDTEKKEMQAIVLVPTHELAIQVIRVIELLSLNSDIKATSTPIIGDVNITRQVDKLRTKPHIIVGTAGRILELIQKKKISAHTMKTIIIDEADRLLDDNNIEAIKAVIKTTLKERQIVMCSASMSARTIERAKLLMKEPQIIKSKTAIEVPETIDHLYFVAEQRDKIDVLRKLVRIINPPKAIAFFGNADDIAEATEKLQFHKLRADGLHGSNIKSDRKKTMDDFKSGKLQLLIASDVAARGLDIEGVTHIFNVHIPERAMDYLHRAGRTGRNGNEGMAISIVTEREIQTIKQFEKELRITVVPKSMYNGLIVEYKKEKKQKLDTTSEYGQRYSKKEEGQGTDDKTSNNKDIKKTDYKKADREGYKDNRGARGERPPYKRGRDEQGEKKFERSDKSEKKFDKYDKNVKRFDKSDKPERKYKPHDKDKSDFKNNKDDRSEKQFDRDGKKPFGGTKFKVGGKGDKPAQKFSRDGKPDGRFKRDGDKPAQKFNRDSKPDGRFKRDGDKPASKFSRDGKPDGKFKRDGDKPAQKFSRDGKPDSRYKKDGSKAGGKFGSDKKGFGKDNRSDSENEFKPGKIKFVGKPPKNLKPWDRKPQSGPKRGK